ncbi:MAG: 2-C-methyl-D-erythritol 4-phosphate cytidylyltransferase [Eubacteriales bacterium]
MRKQCSAIVLAAGQGKRMGTKVQKQYLEILGFPVLYYSLKAFQESSIIDEIILVTGKDEIESCKQEFVQKYNFTKVKCVVAGGKERYDSVYQGLQRVSEASDYIFVQDGARPMLTEEIIQRGYDSVQVYKATVAGVPSKDTVKIVDADIFAIETPVRATVWNVQTPQVFERELIQTAYEKMMQSEHTQVTDDAMVVESYMNHKVKIFEASYENIKITTPEDLKIAECFLNNR